MITPIVDAYGEGTRPPGFAVESSGRRVPTVIPRRRRCSVFLRDPCLILPFRRAGSLAQYGRILNVQVRGTGEFLARPVAAALEEGFRPLSWGCRRRHRAVLSTFSGISSGFFGRSCRSRGCLHDRSRRPISAARGTVRGAGPPAAPSPHTMIAPTPLIDDVPSVPQEHSLHRSPRPTRRHQRHHACRHSEMNAPITLSLNCPRLSTTAISLRIHGTHATNIGRQGPRR